MSTQRPDSDKAVTLSTLRKLKQKGEKFASLTAYDATFANILDEAGVEMILIGDSLGMVVQGHATTVPVTIDHMVYHSRLVARGARRALLMVDMPFMSFATLDSALHNAARLMQEGLAHVVKLESGGDEVGAVRSLSRQGIPVCAHIGLQPQTVHKIGGYRVQGRDEASAQAMLDDAHRLVDAGAEMLLLECVPVGLAKRITESVPVPVIGIGAGPHVDAQILVLHDMLGLTPGKRLRFTKDYMAEHGTAQAAVAAFRQEVKDGIFPGAEHGFE